MKHSRNFGYVLISKETLFQRKYDYYYNVHQNIKKESKEIDNNIKELCSQIHKIKKNDEIYEFSHQIKLNNHEIEF